jgi:hypothetical protein
MSKPKADDPAQSKRFLELAAEIGADGTEEALKQSVGRLGRHVPEPRRKLGKKAAKSGRKR